MTTLADVMAALDALYPPATAEPWDAVGLVVGDPDQPVRRVLLAVDPVAATVREALDGGYDLLLTHHPLFLRGTSSVAAHTPKGALVHALIRGGCALFVAHTNADVAHPGVSDALAAAVGLRTVTDLSAGSGLGRVGDLPEPMTVGRLVEQIAAGLPQTAGGVRASGSPDRVIHRLAVVGGAGDSLLAAAAASGAQALLTADLRHHPATEAPAGLTLIDAAHWATEWPWLAEAARALRAAATVDTFVSTTDTDPWTYCSRSPQA